MATVRVEQFTDPFSPWCWAAQPTLRRLRYEFRDDDVEWTPRTTVLLPGAASTLRSDSPIDSLPTGAEDAGELEDVEALRARWAEVAASTGMPVADDLWAEGLPSSRPACAAVAFVRETTPDRTISVLRRLQEAAFADGQAIDDPSEVASVAGEVAGVEADAVRRGFDDGRAADALAADLERALAVADELDSVEVRGDVSLLSAADRMEFRSEASGEEGDPGATADGEGGTDGVGTEAQANGADDRAGDEPAEPRLVGPPALRVDRESKSVTLVDPRLSYTRLATAFGRSVPETGIEIDDKYATSRMAMHVPREVAESLSGQDFAAEVRPYLARFGRAYLPEVVAGTGVSRDTCLAALESLVARGEAARVGPAEWRIVDEPGAPGRDT